MRNEKLFNDIYRKLQELGCQITLTDESDGSGTVKMKMSVTGPVDENGNVKSFKYDDLLEITIVSLEITFEKIVLEGKEAEDAKVFYLSGFDDDAFVKKQIDKAEEVLTLC